MKFRLSMILLISSAFWVKLWFNKYDVIFGKKWIGGMHQFLSLKTALGSIGAIIVLLLFSLLGFCFCFQVGHCSLSKVLSFFYVAGKENFHQMHVRDSSILFM